MKRDVTYNEFPKLNNTFIFLVVYYWLMAYIKTPNYIMLTLPVTAFVAYGLLHIRSTLIAKETYWVLLFVFFSACLSLIRFDFATLIAVILFGMLIFSVINFSLKISLNLINFLFLMSVLLSIPLYYSGYSYYGFLPGQGGFSHNEVLSGRVSMFPNVTLSIYFAFVVFLINYFFNKSLYQKIFFLSLSIYFIYFGISRTVMMILAVIILFSWFFRLYPLRKNIFYQLVLPFFLLGVPIILVLYIEDIIYYLLSLDIPFITEYFFRGYYSVDDILNDIARTNIWSEHIRLFREHPWGLSISQQELFIDKSLHMSDGGSESFLTRILVRFGFGGLFFYIFIFSLLYRAINEANSYLYLFTYIFIFLGLTYGSFFAAYNVLFLIFISSMNLIEEKPDE